VTSVIPVDAMIPGGIRPADHVHRVTNDDTCSRCRQPNDEDEVRIMLWLPGGQDMLIYCEACTGPEAWAAMAPIVPAC
jgi:hypothetical protein